MDAPGVVWFISETCDLSMVRPPIPISWTELTAKKKSRNQIQMPPRCLPEVLAPTQKELDCILVIMAPIN